MVMTSVRTVIGMNAHGRCSPRNVHWRSFWIHRSGQTGRAFWCQPCTLVLTYLDYIIFSSLQAILSLRMGVVSRGPRRYLIGISNSRCLRVRNVQLFDRNASARTTVLQRLPCLLLSTCPR